MTKHWKTLIIDDEELARQRLKRLLGVHECINIIGEASNGAEGLQQIDLLKPDLIFLDIEMPVLNGFEMLKLLTTPVKVIFTTAYDQYAVKAFEEESIDYLLKPVEQERLETSMSRLNKLTDAQDYAIPLDLLIKQLKVKKEIKTLTVKIGDRILLIKIQELVYVEAEDKYVFLNTIDGKKNLTDFTVNSLAEKLPAHFVRINRGIIINSEQIKEIRKGFNGTFYFIMNDVQNTKLSSSRSYGSALRELFEL